MTEASNIAAMANAIRLNEKQTEADLDDLRRRSARIETLQELQASSDAWVFIRQFHSPKDHTPEEFRV